MYYDDLILSDDKVQIPRKEICEYDFVLKPLIDLVPNFICLLYTSDAADE